MTTIVGFSHRGKLRIRNEDSIGWDETREVAVLADGMGGRPAGEVASRLAVEAVLRTVQRQSGQSSWLGADGDPGFVIQLANRTIAARAERDAGCAGMGSTLTLLCLDDESVVIGHVGDSRAYRLHEGRLVQLTHDHTVAQEQVDHGLMAPEQLRHSRERNMLTRALGLEDSVEPSFLSEPRRRGDVFLLCSDGVWDALERETMEGILNDYLQDPALAARSLVHAAVEASGEDNCSAVLVRC